MLIIFFLMAAITSGTQGVRETLTRKGQRCMTDCVPYNSYHFCYLGWGSSNWDYCTPDYNSAAYQYFSYKVNTPCTSHCGKFGSDNEWCFTGENGDFQFCTSTPGITMKGETCSGPCVDTDGEYTCPVGHHFLFIPYSKGEFCSPPRVDLTESYEVSRIVKDLLAKSEGFKCDLAGLEIGASCPANTRSKRLSENVVRTVGVLALAARLAQRYTEQQVNNYIGTNSVTGFVTRPAEPVVGLNNVDLPLVVRASIYPHHIVQRTTIPSFVARQMIDMQGYRNRVIDGISHTDERGHVVAASLGGPNLPFNFVPQAPQTNRCYYSDNMWYVFENEIRKYLNQNGGHVEYTILITYEAGSRRPVAFGVNILFYDANGTLVRDSGNCFFTNNPTGGSIV